MIIKVLLKEFVLNLNIPSDSADLQADFRQKLDNIKRYGMLLDTYTRSLYQYKYSHHHTRSEKRKSIRDRR